MCPGGWKFRSIPSSAFCYRASAVLGSLRLAGATSFGGNMDNKELRPGTTLYLPVFNEGALFFAGDGHGVQGDGEVCITALEPA